MKQMPAWLKKLIFPGGKWVALAGILGLAGLYLTFGILGESHPFSYIAYVLSAYALTIAVAWLVQKAKLIWRFIHSVPLFHRYLTDNHFKVRSSLLLSFVINLCYTAFKLIYAIWYVSFWDGALALYNLLLCAVRLYLIRRVPADPRYKDINKECGYYRSTGLFLLALDAALGVIAVEIVQHGQSYHYSGTLIYVVALHVFYSLGISVSNSIKYRKFHSPVLSAAKAVNLTTALVGVFTLESAMLASFGKDYPYQRLMTAATGGIVWVLVFCNAVYMVLSARKQEKQVS